MRGTREALTEGADALLEFAVSVGKDVQAHKANRNARQIAKQAILFIVPSCVDIPFYKPILLK